MQRLRLISALLAMPALAVLIAAAGCGGGESEKPQANTGGGGKATSGSSSKSASARTELASTGWGTLKGKVTFEGDPPKPAPIDFEAKKKEDAPYCHMGPKNDTTDPVWRVGSDKGVGNVMVWLQEPKDHYFKIPDAQKDQGETVVISQPYCAFEPHVFVLYPSYYDAKSGKQKSTGQKFKVINNATISHNTNVLFDPLLNPGGKNELLAPKKGNDVKELEFDHIKPCKDKEFGKSSPISISCNIHPWMSAKGRAFDHPFVAVTSGGKEGDKDYGVYEIKDAPAGAEVELVYWHESMSGPKVLKTVTLKDKGTTTEDFTIK
jgi:hypothetical protein